MSTVVKIDARICVKQSENGLTVNRQDISVIDSIEVLRRIQNYVREMDMTMEDKKVPTIEDQNWLPVAPGEEPKVCIAFEPLTHQIQFNVTGLKCWDVCTLLELACSYLNALQLGLIQE